jgi:hypothetical protein
MITPNALFIVDGLSWEALAYAIFKTFVLIVLIGKADAISMPGGTTMWYLQSIGV